MLKKSKGWWWRGVLLVMGLLFLAPAKGLAVVQTTSVQDVVYRADGSAAQGTLLVSWPAFTTSDGSTVAAGTTTVTIGPNGSVAMALAPNAGSEPQGSYYTVVYHLNDGTVQEEYWVVPQTPTATIAEMRSKVVPAAVAQQSATRQYVDTSISSIQANYLPIKGGTVTGPIVLSADPALPLQAATKSYVDANIGKANVTLPVINNVYYSTIYVPGVRTLLATSFNEGTAGVSLTGTKPATDAPGSAWAAWPTVGGTWTFGGSGRAVSTVGGANLISTGNADYTTTFSGVTNTNGIYLVVRWADSGNYLAINLLGPGGVALLDSVAGTTAGTSAVADGATGNVVVSAVGDAITVTPFGGTPIHYTIPVGESAATGPYVGFFNIGTAASYNVGGLTVTSTGSVPTQAACAGFPNADGTCSTPGTNSIAASDGSGHLNRLPEVETVTDSQGNTTIASQQDLNAGIYDPRSTMWAGGIYGPTPAAAAQAMSNQMACDLASGKVAQAVARWPQGNFFWNNLQIAPGSTWIGSGNSLGGTNIQTYNNSPAAVAPYSMTLECADGVTRTDGASNTRVEHFSLGGCANGCTNAPGDTTTTENGPYNAGLTMQSTGGVVEWLYTHNFGGPGFISEGQDAKAFHIRSYGDDEWYYFGPYDPTHDDGFAVVGWHGAVNLLSVDQEAAYIEVYGFNVEATPTNYHHLADIVTGGGDAQYDHLWPQLGQVGIAEPYRIGAGNVFANTRIDFTGLEGFFSSDVAIQFRGGLIDGSCISPDARALSTGVTTTWAANTAYTAGQNIIDSNYRLETVSVAGTSGATQPTWPATTGNTVTDGGVTWFSFDTGTCQQFSSAGVGMSISDVVFEDNPGFGPTYKTSDIGLAYGNYHNVSGSFEKGMVNDPYGQNINFEPQTASLVPVTGASPDVDQLAQIDPVDSTANTIVSFTNVMMNQSFDLLAGNANVTIQNNSHIVLCGGADLNLGSISGFLRFRATGNQSFGSPAQVSQICGGQASSGVSHIIGNTSAPTIAAGTAAGTAPTVGVAGNDLDFTVSLTTGTAPATGALATVTFDKPYALAPRCTLDANNASSAGVRNSIFKSTTTTTYTLSTATALAASTPYVFDVACVQ